MDHFKKKYIKYKAKYINLQNGGANMFMFDIDKSISPEILSNKLFPVNNINSVIGFNIENESEYIRLLNLIQSNNFIVCTFFNEVLKISDYDINALKNHNTNALKKGSTNSWKIFKIYKSIDNIPKKFTSSTPLSGQSASSHLSGQSASFLPHSGQSASTPRSKAWGANLWRLDFDSEEEKIKTEKFDKLASSSTPRSRRLFEEINSSTPRSQVLRDKLTSSTPRSRALEYVSKKYQQQFADLYNRVADLINQIVSISYNDLPQQLHLIIQSIQEINDQKTYDTEDSQQKQKVLHDIKTNFFMNSIFNNNIQRISNSVARSVSFVREIKELSRIIYENLDLVFDSEIEMDVENDEDFAFDTALNLTFEDLINPSNPHRVTLTNALRQIMELRNEHVYKQ